MGDFSITIGNLYLNQTKHLAGQLTWGNVF